MSAPVIWLASYPKSGNTWMRLLIEAYLVGPGVEIDPDRMSHARWNAASRSLLDPLLGVDSLDLTPDEIDAARPGLYRQWAREQPGPVWVKVHDANRILPSGERLFPADVSRAVIYIIRHPCDVAVSLAFHSGHGDMARSVRLLCAKDHVIFGADNIQVSQRLLDWSSHADSWTDRGSIPALLIRYEDMLADPAMALSDVLRFSGVAPEPEPERVAHAVAQTRFDRLRAREEAQGFSEKPRTSSRFFRTGTSGGWRAHLSRELAEKLLDFHGDRMARHGYGLEE